MSAAGPVESLPGTAAQCPRVDALPCGLMGQAFTSIVVGVSEAATSQTAARTAAALAQACGATLHFVTAVVDGQVTVIEVGTDRFVADDVEAARQSLESFVQSLALTVPYTVQAVAESPAKALITAAEMHDADLIVVGNVRMQGLGRVLGSVGNDVAHSAPCSVLVVKTV